MLRWVEQGAAPDRLVANGPGGPRDVAAFTQAFVPDRAIGDARFAPAPPAWCIAGACAAQP
jgi:hypothetical protein